MNQKISKTIFVLAFIFSLSFGIVESKTTNIVLKNIWSQRPDLQVVFPDGFNGNGWTIIDWAIHHGWKENKYLKQFNEDYEKDYIYQKYLPLERALDKIASKQYDVENYNCVDFTKDLQDELEKQNIASLWVTGWTPGGKEENIKHRWIAVQFDSVTGKFVRVSQDWEIISSTIKLEEGTYKTFGE